MGHVVRWGVLSQRFCTWTWTWTIDKTSARITLYERQPGCSTPHPSIRVASPGKNGHKCLPSICPSRHLAQGTPRNPPVHPAGWLMACQESNHDTYFPKKTQQKHPNPWYWDNMIWLYSTDFTVSGLVTPYVATFFHDIFARECGLHMSAPFSHQESTQRRYRQNIT